MWALRKIQRIPYTRRVTNVKVRATTGCRPLSYLVTDRHLRLFGHIASSSPQELSWVYWAHVRRTCLQADTWNTHKNTWNASKRTTTVLSLRWSTAASRLEATVRKTYSHTWLRAVAADLGQQNIGFASAWRKADAKWRLAAHCGHSNAPAEYAVKERRSGAETEKTSLGLKQTQRKVWGKPRHHIRCHWCKVPSCIFKSIGFKWSVWEPIVKPTEHWKFGALLTIVGTVNLVMVYWVVC